MAPRSLELRAITWRRVWTPARSSSSRGSHYESDTVLSLTRRCHAQIQATFYEVFSLMVAGEPLPTSPEAWTRKPYGRRELNALCRLTAEMSDDEIRRRVRAVTYPNMPGAYVELAGHRFVIDAES